MTIEQTVDILKSRLKEIDETSQFHPETIRMAMSFVWGQQISDTIGKGDVNSLDYYAKEYSDQTATENASTGEYHIDLPASVVPTINDKDLQKAVRNLNFVGGRGLNFLPVSSKVYSLYSGQDALNIISGKIFYVVRHDRIIFLDVSSANASILTGIGVRFDLVQSLDNYAYTDNFMAPGGKFEDFLVKTVNYLMGTPPKDLLNNNA